MSNVICTPHRQGQNKDKIMSKGINLLVRSTRCS